MKISFRSISFITVLLTIIFISFVSFTTLIPFRDSNSQCLPSTYGIGSTQMSVSGSTVTITNTQIGDSLYVFVSGSTLGGTTWTTSPPTLSISDSQSNTWSILVSTIGAYSGFNGGSESVIYKATSSGNAGDTITFNFNQAIWAVTAYDINCPKNTLFGEAHANDVTNGTTGFFDMLGSISNYGSLTIIGDGAYGGYTPTDFYSVPNCDNWENTLNGGSTCATNSHSPNICYQTYLGSDLFGCQDYTTQSFVSSTPIGMCIASSIDTSDCSGVQTPSSGSVWALVMLTFNVVITVTYTETITGWVFPNFINGTNNYSWFYGMLILFAPLGFVDLLFFTQKRIPITKDSLVFISLVSLFIGAMLGVMTNFLPLVTPFIFGTIFIIYLWRGRG